MLLSLCACSSGCSNPDGIDEESSDGLDSIESHFSDADHHLQRGLETIDETSNRLDQMVDTLRSQPR